jgi:hypothetical protein
MKRERQIVDARRLFACAVTAVTTLSLIVGPSSPAATAGWQEVYRSPFEVAGFEVDVRTASDVWLVGGRLTSGDYHTFTVHFDGSGWRLWPTGDSPSKTWNLYDIEAVGPTAAWAVGVTPKKALTLRWNGAGWRRVPTPRGTAQLFAVDRIPGTRRLIAVGADRRGGSLALRWSAGRWRYLHIGPGVRGKSLYGVDVVSKRLAWAVGDEGLILKHTPKGWTRVDQGRFRGVQFWDVAAVRPNRAFAVGTVTHLVRWNGRNWRVVPRFWASSVHLAAVAAAGDAAWVTGARVGSTSDKTRPFAMRWQAGRWDVVPVRDVGNSFYDVAVGAGCVWAATSLSEGESNSALYRRCG